MLKTKKLLKIIIVLMFLLITLKSSISAPPVTTTLVGDNTLDIKYPLIFTIKANQSYEMYFHVFNGSNGVPLFNDSVYCHLHLYNQTGSHIVDSNLTTMEYDYDFGIEIGAGNFSTIGYYSYIIQCNNSNQGGRTSVQLEVTKDGISTIAPTEIEITENSDSIIIISLFFMFILLIFLSFSIYGFVKAESLIGKYSFICLIYLLLIAISFISYRTATDYLTDFIFLAEFLNILFNILMIAFFPFIILSFAYIILKIKDIKEIRRLMEEGFEFEEAERRIKGGKR